VTEYGRTANNHRADRKIWGVASEVRKADVKRTRLKLSPVAQVLNSHWMPDIGSELGSGTRKLTTVS